MTFEEQAKLIDVTGTCHYCGQMRAVWVKNPDEYSQEDIDKIASSECSCPGAEREEKKRQLMNSGMDAIRLTLEEKHRKNAAKVMMAGLEFLCSGRLKKITIKIDEDTTATMYLANTRCIAIGILQYLVNEFHLYRLIIHEQIGILSSIPTEHVL